MRFVTLLSLAAIVAAALVRADVEAEDVLTLEVVREQVPDFLETIVSKLDSDVGDTVVDSVEDIFEKLFGIDNIFDGFEKRDLNKVSLARGLMQRNKSRFAKRENEKDEDEKDENDRGKRSVYKREYERDENENERDEEEDDENERDEDECDENERDEQ